MKRGVKMMAWLLSLQSGADVKTLTQLVLVQFELMLPPKFFIVVIQLPVDPVG